MCFLLYYVWITYFLLIVLLSFSTLYTEKSTIVQITGGLNIKIVLFIGQELRF